MKTAANMADERGIANVTLKALAAELGVKTSSLYKHFNGGFDELNKELMLYGWCFLESKIKKVTIGRAKDDAIMAICYVYRNFVAKHKDCLKLCNGTICIIQRNIYRRHKEWCLFF